MTASLLPNIHTIQSNALHMTLNPLILYICSVYISNVQLLLQCCFGVQYPSQSVEHHVVANSTHSTSNFPWLRYVFQSFLSLVRPRNLLKIFCAIDRLRLWKNCYHSCVFSSGCLISIGDLPNSTQKIMYLCSALSPKLIKTAFYF